MKPTDTTPTPSATRLTPTPNPLVGQNRSTQVPRDWQAQLQANVRHRRRAAKRRFWDARRVANAAHHLKQLPEPGETLHCVMKGNYNGWDLVPAILRLIDRGQRINELWVATLGFNSSNAASLMQLLETGAVGRCRFVCSVYYEAHESQVCKKLAADLARFGGTFSALRSHAKIILAATSCGHHLVNESSANLRSCRMVEQFTLTNDRQLFDFHATWLAEMCRT